jgi:hypothetical protein
MSKEFSIRRIRQAAEEGATGFAFRPFCKLFDTLVWGLDKIIKK